MSVAACRRRTTRRWWTGSAPPDSSNSKPRASRRSTCKEQTLAYWLTQASIAIDPINYDQNSAWGLRQKALLEEILRHPQGVNPQALRKITDFTKLFWANRGNHNEMTAQKFLPEFTFDELKAAAAQAAPQRRPSTRQGPAAIEAELERPPALAVRRRLRAHHHRQEPAGQSRHPAGQRQQLLLRA